MRVFLEVRTVSFWCFFCFFCFFLLVSAASSHLLRQLRRLDRPLDHLHHVLEPVGRHQSARLLGHAGRFDRIHNASPCLSRKDGQDAAARANVEHGFPLELARVVAHGPKVGARAAVVLEHVFLLVSLVVVVFLGGRRGGCVRARRRGGRAWRGAAKAVWTSPGGKGTSRCRSSWRSRSTRALGRPQGSWPTRARRRPAPWARPWRRGDGGGETAESRLGSGARAETPGGSRRPRRRRQGARGSHTARGGAAGKRGGERRTRGRTERA